MTSQTHDPNPQHQGNDALVGPKVRISPALKISLEREGHGKPGIFSKILGR